jgi:hypothetical protein
VAQDLEIRVEWVDPGDFLGQVFEAHLSDGEKSGVFRLRLVSAAVGHVTGRRSVEEWARKQAQDEAKRSVNPISWLDGKTFDYGPDNVY